ncbi:8003_t:CDS:1 [Funneliformis geosporum]|uniref:8742_t:CDS:1 n=1 Tax=Funneliformis geosporum TaxID=1117311 RepID=A0A9W4SHG6_9GLOM|nr:8742_t:CDS:1 [Funneliformis geosporum]CAI2185507.1 8003_t:CDS:1 [Funneliformis geosporum]
MSQRNKSRNRNRSSNSTRESLSHPYWHAAAYYFMEALRVSTSTSMSTPQMSSILLPFSPPSVFLNNSQNPSSPFQQTPQNPYPIETRDNSINNLANIFRTVALEYENVEYHTLNSLSSTSLRQTLFNSTHQSTADNQSSDDRNQIISASHGASMVHPFTSLNFTLDSFPYTLSTLERYEIQIRLQGKITPTNIISSRLLNNMIIYCKDSHKSCINSQSNIYCKKGNNVYHYHNLSNASFYSKREDGSSIYVDRFGDITYKTKEQERFDISGLICL